MTQWSTDLDALTSVDMGPHVSLDDAAGFISDVFTRRGPDVAALQLSIFLAAAREPSLHDVVAAPMRSLERLAAEVLRKVGVHDADEVVAGIVALIAGTALRRQSRVYSEQDEARFLATSIRSLVATHAIGPDGVTAALAELGNRQA